MVNVDMENIRLELEKKTPINHVREPLPRLNADPNFDPVANDGSYTVEASTDSISGYVWEFTAGVDVPTPRMTLRSNVTFNGGQLVRWAVKIKGTGYVQQYTQLHDGGTSVHWEGTEPIQLGPGWNDLTFDVHADASGTQASAFLYFLDGPAEEIPANGTVFEIDGWTLLLEDDDARYENVVNDFNKLINPSGTDGTYGWVPRFKKVHFIGNQDTDENITDIKPGFAGDFLYTGVDIPFGSTAIDKAAARSNVVDSNPLDTVRFGGEFAVSTSNEGYRLVIEGENVLNLGSWTELASSLVYTDIAFTPRTVSTTVGVNYGRTRLVVEYQRVQGHGWIAFKEVQGVVNRPLGGAVEQVKNFINILSPVSEIKYGSRALDVGSLNAEIWDADLDPMKHISMKSGSEVRLSAKDGSGEWQRLWTGKLNDVHVDYPYEGKPHITLTANNHNTTLANAPAGAGVGRVDDAGYFLQEAMFPWSLNRRRSYIYDPDMWETAYETNESMLEALRVLQDTDRCWIMVDKYNVLHVNKELVIAGPGAPIEQPDITPDMIFTDYQEPSYNYIDASGGFSKVINSITIKKNEGGSVTDYGPYEDGISILENGRRHMDITAQVESPASHAYALLREYSDRKVDATTIRFKVNTPEHLGFATRLDVFTIIGIEYKDLIDKTYRIEGYSGTIRPGSWDMELFFEGTDTGASIVGSSSHVKAQAGLAGRTMVGYSEDLATATTTTLSPLNNNDVELEMPYPSSGTVTVLITIRARNTAGGQSALMGFEIRDESNIGTLRVEADTRRCAWVREGSSGGLDHISTWSGTISGLPTSGKMYVRGMYQRGGSLGQAEFRMRSISVIPSG